MVQEKLKRNIKSLSNFDIYYEKRHTHLLSLIILFYCSTVIIVKNTKNSKNYTSLGTAI